MRDTVTLSRSELERLRGIADIARRLRSAQHRVLQSANTDEMLEAVREEARSLRALDAALAEA
ncbi:hypothetical protein [Vulgatibacter incomptus]|uniref:hypothetical protein n=1 Tax=Vulgatibacter incomptus TaxID=1391653 RepID=UPI00147026A2|nr:hypothetical protein [Vulgatibacter incomptus]